MLEQKNHRGPREFSDFSHFSILRGFFDLVVRISLLDQGQSNWSQTWDFQRGEHRERVGKSQHRTKPALPPGKLHFMMVYDHNIKNFAKLTTNFRFFQHFSKNVANILNLVVRFCQLGAKEGFGSENFTTKSRIFATFFENL